MTDLECRLRKVGDAPDGARWLHCESCGITGKAYAYPHPLSNVRCFAREPWPDDQITTAPEFAKGVALGLAGLAAIAALVVLWTALGWAF